MSDRRWRLDRASEWQANAGWLVGCNFTPSTAANQLELWQADTFDPTTIERELGWAAGLGMNAIRLYLHNLVFDADGASFLDRIDRLLAIAQSHRIGVMPVLFDGVWHPRPRLGPQPDPVPRRHNSVWVQGPGSEVLYDADRWPSLRPYVDAVLERFGHDDRVVAWDLFNEPDQMDRDTLASGSRDRKAEASTALLDQVFDWARDASPDQPLTAGLWEFDDHAQPVDNAVNALALERSDIITFHCYEPADRLSAVIEELSKHRRPLVCTEWLARSAGSTADLLTVFADHDVGAINWGLVDGRTQTRFPWLSWTESVADDAPWFHELLYADGTPYDHAEVDLFRSLTSRRSLG